MNRTKIEYLDYTWNPIVGCSGLGCAVVRECWARKQARRHKNSCEFCSSFSPHVHWERLEQPLAVKKSARIGTCFMGEFYDKEICEWVRASIFMRVMEAKQHTFVIFTKQPQNIDLDEPIPENVWLCVSVNRKKDLWRINELRHTSAKIKGVSFEPLYEDLDLIDLHGIDWAIVGAQTRPHLLPSDTALATILDATETQHVPLFMKNSLVPQVPKLKLLKQFPSKEGVEHGE